MAGSSFDSENLQGINEINITPFVDVVLVLLVIFMVTAPMMMKDVLGLQLPKTSASQTQSLSTFSVAVTKTGQYLLNGELLTIEQLRERALEASRENAQTEAVLSADVEARHGDVVRAIDIIKSSGIESFAIQVEKNSQ